jgi:hypothetical protein
MPIPNGGLITETNRQYYAGAQQFYIDAAGAGKTFTSTFNTDLIFGSSDNANGQYGLNNFHLYSSPDALTWTELTPNNSKTTATNSNANVPQGTQTLTITVANVNIVAGMLIQNSAETQTYGTVTQVLSTTTFTCAVAIQIPANAALVFKFAEPYSEAGNIITVNSYLAANSYIKIQLIESAIENNHGEYAYTRLTDVIDNFLIAYVGAGKLIPSVKRTDVIFHARRGLQEFSYDTLKSVKSTELTVPPSLSLAIPQDYVNYVKTSWVDELGVLHPIYPTNNLNQSPYYTFTQDYEGKPIQDNFDNNTEVTSQTDATWNKTNPRYISGGFNNDLNNANILDRNYTDGALGQRYGLEPQTSQKNGWFKINERKGTFSFTSNLANKLIILQYVSDGNAYDLDSRIPKLAEEALYAYIIYSILSVSTGIQEYVVRRFKQEKSAKLRNAKIRLSNLKLDQIVQVMRGKSKWIKH